MIALAHRCTRRRASSAGTRNVLIPAEVKNADAQKSIHGLLCARRERPSGRRYAEQRDELATL